MAPMCTRRELDPADHFCRYGWREGRKPNIYFDTQWYLQTNPGVARLRINPLVHYVICEARWKDVGRYRISTRCGTARPTTIPAGQFALAHFLTHRRSQKYSPTPMFDVAWYVAAASPRNWEPIAIRSRTSSRRAPIGISIRQRRFNAADYRKRHIGRPSRQFRHLCIPIATIRWCIFCGPAIADRGPKHVPEFSARRAGPTMRPMFDLETRISAISPPTALSRCRCWTPRACRELGRHCTTMTHDFAAAW